MSFSIYVVGLIVLMIGLIYAAVTLHIATQWIVIGSMVVLGFGILSAVKATRQKDSN